MNEKKGKIIHEVAEKKNGFVAVDRKTTVAKVMGGDPDEFKDERKECHDPQKGVSGEDDELVPFGILPDRDHTPCGRPRKRAGRAGDPFGDLGVAVCLKHDAMMGEEK